MPQIQLTKPDFSQFYSNLRANNARQKIGYAMDEIALGLLKAQEASGDNSIDPSYYDQAINQLNLLKQGVGDKAILQSLDEQITRYGIARNQIVKSLSSGGVGSGVSDDNLKSELESYVKNEKTKVLQDTENLRNPEQMIGNLYEKNYELAEYVRQEAENYEKMTGNYPKSLEKIYSNLVSDGTYYLNLAQQDTEGRAQYGMYLKTDSMGGVEDVLIKDQDASFPTNDEGLNAGWKGEWHSAGEYNGMSVFLKEYKKNEEGVPTVKWAGQTLTIGDDGENWTLPQDTTVNNFIENNFNSLPFYREKGSFIETSDGKAYILGGLDGKDDKYHYVSDWAVTKAMNWQDQYAKTVTPVSDEQFEQFKDFIGDPITLDDIENAKQNKLEKKLQAINREASRLSGDLFTWEQYGEALKETLGGGFLGDVFRKKDKESSRGGLFETITGKELKPIGETPKTNVRQEAQKFSESGVMKFYNRAKNIFKGIYTGMKGE